MVSYKLPTHSIEIQIVCQITEQLLSQWLKRLKRGFGKKVCCRDIMINFRFILTEGLLCRYLVKKQLNTVVLEIILHTLEQNNLGQLLKLRLVYHSSLKNGSWSLNECLPKGPNSLNSMFDVSVRFRCYEAGLVFDLYKAYHSMHTGLVEKL